MNERNSAALTTDFIKDRLLHPDVMAANLLLISKIGSRNANASDASREVLEKNYRAMIERGCATGQLSEAYAHHPYLAAYLFRKRHIYNWGSFSGKSTPRFVAFSGYGSEARDFTYKSVLTGEEKVFTFNARMAPRFMGNNYWNLGRNIGRSTKRDFVINRSTGLPAYTVEVSLEMANKLTRGAFDKLPPLDAAASKTEPVVATAKLPEKVVPAKPAVPDDVNMLPLFAAAAKPHRPSPDVADEGEKKRRTRENYWLD